MKLAPGDADAYMKQRARRGGFDRLMIGHVAKQWLAMQAQSNALKAIPKPGSIYDLYDDHPYCSLLDPDKQWTKPFHLEPYVSAMEGACSERLRLLLAAPPQHNKSTTGLMALAYHIVVNRDRRHFFVSYNHKRAAAAFEVFCKDVLGPLGIPFSASNLIVSALGSTVTFCSLREGITGGTCDGIMMLDDLVKNAEEGRSPTVKERIWQGFVRDITSREWGQMSVVVVMTRWDTDDLTGRLLKERDSEGRCPWTYLNFKAVCEDTVEDPLHRQIGTYLLERQRSKVDEIRERSEFDFYCQYQGTPTVPGLQLFAYPQTYDKMPGRLTAGYGIDVAYSGRGDWSVLIRGLRDPNTGDIYLDFCVREQSDINSFGAKASSVQKARPGPCTWEVGGQELYTSVNILRKLGLRLQPITARGAKQHRYWDLAQAWGKGKIMVPAHPSEAMRQFIEEVVTFTGDNRRHDDCASALFGLWKSLGSSLSPLSAGRQEGGDVSKRFFEPPNGEQTRSAHQQTKRRMGAPISSKLFASN